MLNIPVVITLILIVSTVFDTLSSISIISKNKVTYREMLMANEVFIKYVINAVLNILAAIMFIYYLMNQ